MVNDMYLTIKLNSIFNGYLFTGVPHSDLSSPVGLCRNQDSDVYKDGTLKQ